VPSHRVFGEEVSISGSYKSSFKVQYEILVPCHLVTVMEQTLESDLAM